MTIEERRTKLREDGAEHSARADIASKEWHDFADQLASVLRAMPAPERDLGYLHPTVAHRHPVVDDLHGRDLAQDIRTRLTDSIREADAYSAEMGRAAEIIRAKTSQAVAALEGGQ
jgi:hypothetical protein